MVRRTRSHALDLKTFPDISRKSTLYMYKCTTHSSVLTHLCLLKCFSEILHNLRHTFGIQKPHTEAVFLFRDVM